MAGTQSFESIQIGSLEPFIPPDSFNPDTEKVVIALDTGENIIARYETRPALSRMIGEFSLAHYWLDDDNIPDEVREEFGDALIRRRHYQGMSIAHAYDGLGGVRLRLESSKFWGSFITDGKPVGISTTAVPIRTGLKGQAFHENGVNKEWYRIPSQSTNSPT